MAFEGLLAKNIPALLRTLAPHVPQLLGGVAERFGRDTHDLRETLNTELAALRRSHGELSQGLEAQGGAATEMRQHLLHVERKLDRLAEAQDGLNRHLVEMDERTKASLQTVRTILLVTMLFAILSCAASVAMFVLRK